VACSQKSLACKFDDVRSAAPQLEDERLHTSDEQVGVRAIPIGAVVSGPSLLETRRTPPVARRGSLLLDFRRDTC
jgi:hypothetical protein